MQENNIMLLILYFAGVICSARFFYLWNKSTPQLNEYNKDASCFFAILWPLIVPSAITFYSICSLVVVIGYIFIGLILVVKTISFPKEPLKRVIRVRDFSQTPGPRYRHEGSFSGEAFRKEVLKPALIEAVKAGERIILDLDYTNGYSTGFLHEVFYGIAEDFVNLGKDQNKLQELIEIRSEQEPYLVPEIQKYLSTPVPTNR